MFPVWIAAVFGALFMAYVAVDVPRTEAAVTALESDVAATNMVAYRRAVQRYLEANPGATGTIADPSLSGYWLMGYIRNPNWTNLVSGGALYVYSTAAVPDGMLSVLYRMSTENLLSGTKNGTTGRLQSHNGFDTGIVLPAAIPSGAIVMMGK